MRRHRVLACSQNYREQVDSFVPTNEQCVSAVAHTKKTGSMSTAACDDILWCIPKLMRFLMEKKSGGISGKVNIISMISILISKLIHISRIGCFMSNTITNELQL